MGACYPDLLAVLVQGTLASIQLHLQEFLAELRCCLCFSLLPSASAFWFDFWFDFWFYFWFYFWFDFWFDFWHLRVWASARGLVCPVKLLVRFQAAHRPRPCLIDWMLVVSVLGQVVDSVSFFAGAEDASPNGAPSNLRGPAN